MSSPPPRSLVPRSPSLTNFMVSADAGEKKALRQQKRELFNLANGGVNEPPVNEPKLFKDRTWRYLAAKDRGEEKEGVKIKIMTWNMLAQALVRRELFPGSDFLRIKDRLPTLMKELVQVDADIVCLQELDRLEDHLPTLTLEYSYVYHIGYDDKKHGILIGYKTRLFELVGERTGRLDELPIFDSLEARSTTPTPPTRRELGLARSTRNVFLLTALKFKDREGGIIIGTTHLFWHPTATYERARQTGILFKEAKKFRDFGGSEEWRNWEVVLAGDFNTQPMEIAYSLILSDKLDPIQADLLRQSTVVHHSVDKKYDPDYVSPDYVPPELRNTSNATPEDTDAEEATAEGGSTGKMVRNSREGLDEDGLIGLEGLKTLFDYRDLSVPSPTTVGVDPENMETIDDEVLAKKSTRSAYGSIGHHFATEFAGNYYFDRSPEVHATNGWIIPEDPKVIAKRKEGTLEERIRRGDFEPKWTNFTPLWRCTLDYIFLLPQSTLSHHRAPSQFTGLLEMHTADVMSGGLPRKGVGASDHESLGAELQIYAR